jgi:hypothetical protein
MERRQFSGGMKGKNLRYLNETSQPASVARVGFLLLEHFSLPAFTQTLDTFVTANLLRPDLFASRTFGCDDGEVISDLGLVIEDTTARPRNQAPFHRPPSRASASPACGTVPGSSGVPGCCKATAAPSTRNIARRWVKCPRRPTSPANPT